jgi:deoxyinosine 3'endonuclease (endonuclease V)
MSASRSGRLDLFTDVPAVGVAVAHLKVKGLEDQVSEVVPLYQTKQFTNLLPTVSSSLRENTRQMLIYTELRHTIQSFTVTCMHVHAYNFSYIISTYINTIFTPTLTQKLITKDIHMLT